MESELYLNGVQKRLMDVPDPLARARAANDEITAMTAVLAELARLRADSVRQARETLSARAVGDALGVTRARVYQILEGATPED